MCANDVIHRDATFDPTLLFQFLPKGAVDPLIYGKQIPTPSLETYLPPRTDLFGDQTWENVLIHEYWDAL